MSPKFCSECGAALQPDTRFCGECGQPLQGAPQRPTVSSPPPPKSPPAGSPKPSDTPSTIPSAASGRGGGLRRFAVRAVALGLVAGAGWLWQSGDMRQILDRARTLVPASWALSGVSAVPVVEPMTPPPLPSIEAPEDTPPLRLDSGAPTAVEAWARLRGRGTEERPAPTVRRDSTEAAPTAPERAVRAEVRRPLPRLQITTDPPGAYVMREDEMSDDDQRTPLTIEVDPEQDELLFVVLDGYTPEVIDVAFALAGTDPSGPAATVYLQLTPMDEGKERSR